MKSKKGSKSEPKPKAKRAPKAPVAEPVPAPVPAPVPTPKPEPEPVPAVELVPKLDDRGVKLSPKTAELMARAAKGEVRIIAAPGTDGVTRYIRFATGEKSETVGWSLLAKVAPLIHETGKDEKGHACYAVGQA